MQEGSRRIFAGCSLLVPALYDKMRSSVSGGKETEKDLLLACCMQEVLVLIPRGCVRVYGEFRARTLVQGFFLAILIRDCFPGRA
jgi:hypothetical protein